MASIFNNITSAYNLKTHGTLAGDLVNGCPVKLNNQNNTVWVQVIVNLNEWTENKDLIIEKCKANKIAKPNYANGHLTFGISSAVNAVSQYAAIKEIITAYASSSSHSAVCPYCGMGGCDIVGLKDTHFLKMHRACQERALAVDKAKIGNHEGSLLAGIFGAILLSSIIYVVSFFIAIGLERVVGYLFILSPIMCEVGYSLFKGPYGKRGTISCILTALLGFFLYCYVECSYAIGELYRVSFTEAFGHPVDVLELLFSTDYLEARAFQIVFFAVGFIVLIAMKPASVKGAIKDLSDTTELNIPLQ